jgi:glycosyltransferase involved in cell wall biosynthesis
MTGTLVPPANSDALAHAFLGYLNDRTTARRHGRAAYRAVESRFSLERMVSDYARVYEGELAAAGSPIPPDNESADGTLHSADTQTAPN